MDAVAIPIAVLSFVCSGLVWTCGGYVANWRKNHKNPEWEGFNKKSLRDDIVLGLVLGIGGVIYLIYNGELESLVVPTAQQFVQSIGSNFVAIGLVDKFIVGGLLKK